jgi:predicted DsbA family dithiol-disulfide isomerase
MMDVEIWVDIACPWCFLGKRRFEAALAGFEQRDDVRITWRSFELDPNAPAEVPGRHDEQLAAKLGRSVEEINAMHEQMTAMAAAEGVPFRFEAVRGGSTFDAHRLTHLAAAHGRGDEMEERLMRARHAEGALLSDAATLRRLALEVGLPAEAVDELLAGDAYADAVRDDERTAAALGIQGVPFFVVDRRLAVSGAQSPAVFGELLGQASAAAPAAG